MKIVIILSVVINLVLGILIAQRLGNEKALRETNQLYLSAACTNFSELRNRLENYNTDHLPITLTTEGKQAWVQEHLSRCSLVPDSSTKSSDSNINQLLFAENVMLLQVVKFSGNLVDNKARVDEVMNDGCDLESIESFITEGYQGKRQEPIRKAMVCTASLAAALGFRN